MNITAQQKVSEELAPGEKLLWCGQPRGGLRWYVSDVTEIPFSIIWLCGVSFIAYQFFTAPMPFIIAIFFRIFAAIFICIGITFVMRKWIDMWNRERIYYGLTDRDIIIVSTFVGKRVNRFPLHELGEVKLLPSDEVCGTIDFGLERYKHLRFNTPSMNFRVPVKLPFLPGEGGAFYRFELIENAPSVYRLIEDATGKVDAIGSIPSFPDSVPGRPKQRRFAWLGLVLPLIGIVFGGPHLVKFSREWFQVMSRHETRAREAKKQDDGCANWLAGQKAGDLVAAARSRHPEYANLSPEQAHAKGLEHDRRREYADAIHAWECEVARKPASLDGWNDIGYAYQNLDNPERALEYARRSTEIDSGFGHGHYTAGRALLIMGRFAEARDELEKAIRNGWQQGGDSEMLLGLALRGTNDESGAMAAFQRALRIRPGHRQTEQYLAGERFSPTWPKCCGQ